MTKLVEFPLENGTSVYIEVDEKLPTPKSQPVNDRISLPDGVTQRASQSFEKALTTVETVANAIIQRVKDLNQPADSVEVKFGIKMSAELGAVIASGTAEVNYEITMKWDNQKKS